MNIRFRSIHIHYLVFLFGVVSSVFSAAGIPADTIRFEAEDMAAESSSWVVKDHYRGWYGGVPLGYRMLAGARGKLGKTTKEISIAESGPYRLWVRYLDVQEPYRGLFKVSVVQPIKVIVAYRLSKIIIT